MPQQPPAGKWITHPADRLNAVMALGAPVLLFAPFVVDWVKGYEALYGIEIFALIGKTNYRLHLHIHHPFSRNRTLNLLFDLAMGMTTGMTASNWRIQHLYGHHRGVDMPYRGDRSWHMEKYSMMRAISFSIVSLSETMIGPVIEAFRNGVRANITSPINYRWAFCEQMLLLVFVAAITCWQPWLFAAYLLPWYFATLYVTRYVDYLNHYGCDENSKNPYVRANNSASWWFNTTTHNFGYHTAHHIRPGAHWTELPDIHKSISDRIPADYIKPFSWSGALIPYHFVRSRLGKM
ncbi:fatty acid desaturase [soil metagenome]